jgi:hypothetical protein
MYIFKTKIQIWVNLGGFCDGRSWYILWPFGIFYGHLVYFTRFGILCQENLATLVHTLSTNGQY